MANKYEKPTRGISKNAGVFDKEEVVKTRWTRLGEWSKRPKNACNVFVAIALMCYASSSFGAGIYLVPIAWLLLKYFLKQNEVAPLKIPIQEKILDLNQLHSGKRVPDLSQGIFFLGKSIDSQYSGKEIWLTNDDTRQHFLILGTTGAGKAIPYSSQVHTPQGWKKASDIRVGDLITTPFESKAAEVTGVFPQGMRKLWQVEFSDGRTARVDGAHLWEVHHKNSSAPQVMTTKALQERMAQGLSDFHIIISDALEKPEQKLPMSPYDMGVILGNTDGSSDYKSVPSVFLEGSLEQRWALLQGLMDAHGRCDGNELYFDTDSSRIAEDVCHLARGLGGVARIVHEEAIYTVSIHLKTPEKAFSLPGKRDLASNIDRCADLKLKISSIKETNETEDCVCFLVNHPRHLFVIDDYVVTHNTELLMAFAANALSWGSGLIFVDGKGDIKLMGAMYALVKRWGRDADFLLLNFMPLPNANFLVPGESISNSMNPYVTADADDIKQQIVGLMPESGGDGMWKDRAMTMLEAEVMCLTWCRDNGILDMSLSSLRQYILLENLAKFADPEQFPGMPEKNRENVRLYLSSLGNYDFNKKGSEQEADVAKQHSYLEMQLSGPFAALANQYGAIFDTDFGEVDMFDVVLNRRILVCLLPSLAKSAEDVERMGKIIVASLKSMMGATLGNLGMTADPTVLSLLKVRVTAAPYPFLVILDEVGYYTVSGMAMMAAQVRSLGFSMIYAAQDLKAMTRNNEKEAQSIIANTNVKIIMRTEDSDTMELAVKSGGQAARIKATGYKPKEETPVFGGGEWSQNLDYAISFENRINELDLKSQDEGFMTVLYKDIIVRGRSFYVATLDTYKDEDMVGLSPNQFLTVRKPDAQAFESSRQIPKILVKMKDANLTTTQTELTQKIRAQKSDLNVLCKIFDASLASPKYAKKDLKSLSCIALGGLSVLAKGENEAMGDIIKQTRKPQPMTTIDSEFEGEEEIVKTGIPKPEIRPATTKPAQPVATKAPPPVEDKKAAPAPVAAINETPSSLDVDGIMDGDIPKPLSGIEINNDGARSDIESDITSSDTVERVMRDVASQVSFQDADTLDATEKASVSDSINAAVNETLGIEDADIPTEADLRVHTRDLSEETEAYPETTETTSYEDDDKDMGWGDLSNLEDLGESVGRQYEDIEAQQAAHDQKKDEAEGDGEKTSSSSETGTDTKATNQETKSSASENDDDDIIDLSDFVNRIAND